MAEPDYSLAAHPYVPPAANPLETLQGIERYRILQNQAKTTGLEAQQKQIDTDALKNYGDNGDTRALRGATPELRVGATAGNRGEEENKKDVMSRDANYIMGEKDPHLKQYLWDKKKADYVKKGWVDQATADKYPTPHDGVLGNLARGNISVEQEGQMSGATAGNEAAARAPYQVEQTEPGRTVRYPAVGPGGPQEGAPAPRRSLIPGVNPPAFSGAPSAPGGPAPAATPPAVQPPAGSPASKGPPGTVNAVPVNKTPAANANPYAAEVPSVPVGHDMPTGRGIVQPGIDPVRTAAREEGLKKFNEDIEPTAAAAAHTRASLGTMKAELDKGVTTDRLAELKTSVGAILYGLTKDADFAKKATGLTTANQEVFNKESTRMGLTFARQTEGAREAVAAIRIALGANPSLLNTEEGNRKIIGIMDQASKYDQERAKAAQAYMAKNDGHLTGFDTWFSQAHPPASFISKAVPYSTVVNGKHIAKDDLQPGTTYTYGGEKGDQFKGTWDGSHFQPVK